MKGFAAGVVVGAALGVAATLAAARRDDVAPTAPPPRAHDAAAPDAGSAPATTPVQRVAAPRAAEAPSEAPPASTAAPAPAPRLDVETAPLDELVAALRGPIDGAGKLPGGWSPALICGAIARRFPGFRYPTDLVMHLIAMARCDDNGLAAFDGAVASWTDDFALAEFARLLGSGAPDDRCVVHAIGRVLRTRGGGLPSDTCAALLRDANADVRRRGVELSEFAKEVDVAGLRAVASRDPEPSMRASAIYAIRNAVVDQGRVRSEDVSETILGALRDPDADVRSAAECALVAAGRKGANAAFEILVRDGDVGDAEDLVLAVVADGRAADVLDLRPSPQIVRYVATALADLADKRPELLRDASRRFAELRAAAAANDSSDVADRLFVAARKVLGTRVVVESALARDLGVWTRMAAINALLDEPTTWREGHELARRIAADRTESGRMRLEALDVLDRAPEGREDEVQAETRKFLSELFARRDERPRPDVDHGPSRQGVTGAGILPAARGVPESLGPPRSAFARPQRHALIKETP